MDIKLWHLWYSEKEALAGLNPVSGKLLDGSYVLYTEATQDKKPFGLWEDYKYLGVGDFVAEI